MYTLPPLLNLTLVQPAGMACVRVLMCPGLFSASTCYPHDCWFVASCLLPPPSLFPCLSFIQKPLSHTYS